MDIGKQKYRRIFFNTACLAMVAFIGLLLAGSAVEAKISKKPVRVAIIGGMTRTGMWQAVAKMFTIESGYPVKLVATGPRPVLAKTFRAGRADLLTMHSGDVTTDLVADGYGVNMRPWTHNNLVIVGSKSDPAGIKGMTNGAAALRKIAAARAHYLDLFGAGKREVAHNAWKRAKIVPMGAWVLKDEHLSHTELLGYVAAMEAYCILGRIPILVEKLKPAEVEIMVENDPAMHRPYIVMEANGDVFDNTNVKGARALSAFLLTSKVQNFLATFRAVEFGGIPLFYPLRRAAFN